MFKKIALAFAVLASTTSSFASQPVVKINLGRFDMDAQLGAYYQHPQSASITIDKVKRELTLVIIPKAPSCRPGTMCPMGIPAPLIVNLPMVSKKTDGCNEVSYVARRDSRPVDGIFEEISVTDYSEATCMYIRANTTTVVYRTISFGRADGKTIETRSVLESLDLLPKNTTI